MKYLILILPVWLVFSYNFTVKTGVSTEIRPILTADSTYVLPMSLYTHYVEHFPDTMYFEIIEQSEIKFIKPE